MFSPAVLLVHVTLWLVKLSVWSAHQLLATIIILVIARNIAISIGIKYILNSVIRFVHIFFISYFVSWHSLLGATVTLCPHVLSLRWHLDLYAFPSDPHTTLAGNSSSVMSGQENGHSSSRLKSRQGPTWLRCTPGHLRDFYSIGTVGM